MPQTSLLSVKDKIAVITGASSGIGKAIAELLVEEGCFVVNADIVEPKHTPAATANRYRYVKCDITSVEDVQQLYTSVNQQFGPPHFLILNAGKGIHEKLAEGDPEKWFQVINLNVMGTLRVLRSFLPGLLEQSPAHIVFLSSIAAHKVYTYGAIYSATKAAIDTIAATLQLEVQDKARVTTIAPGVVDTSFFEHLQSGRLSVEEIGFGALSPTEVADSVLFALTRNDQQVINNITLRPIRQSF